MNHWIRSAICDLKRVDGHLDQLTHHINKAYHCGMKVVWLNAYSDTLDIGSLREATRYTHALGMKVIADFSTIPDEASYLEVLTTTVGPALMCEIDGISLPDFPQRGVTDFVDSLARRYCPQREIVIIRPPTPWADKGLVAPTAKKISVLHPAELVSPASPEFCATVLQSQIRHALRTPTNGIQLWNPAPDTRPHPDIPHPEYPVIAPHTRHLYTTLLSCLKGSFQLTLPSGLTSDLETAKLRRLLAWRQEIEALQHGNIVLHASHTNVISFTRKAKNIQITCVFNTSDRFVRKSLPDKLWNAGVVSGSGLRGGRIIHHHIDLDPWGALFLRA